MIKRTNYMIDKRYQMRTAFSIIGIETVIATIILIVITVSVVFNNRTLRDNNVRITNIYDIENSIFASLSSMPGTVQDPALKKAMIQNARNHETNMENLNKTMADNSRIITANIALLIAIFAVIVIEAFVLFLVIIRKTHRVSGPIYVISSVMRDIINGKDPRIRPLRKNDELQEFYDLFKEMVGAIQARERGKISRDSQS